MFTGLRAKAKLKKHGYTIKASQKIPMCYEVINLSNDKCEGYVLKDRDGWYLKHDRQMWFSTPEEVALWFYGLELL